MNEEIKAAVEEAIAPLKQEIETVQAMLYALSPLLKLVQAKELPAPVAEAQAILGTIPEATVKALKVVNVGFDPKMVWFQLIREDGSRISVKKQANDFRIRVRDQGGKLLRQATASFNGLNAALAALAGPLP